MSRMNAVITQQTDMLRWTDIPDRGAGGKLYSPVITHPTET